MAAANREQIQIISGFFTESMAKDIQGKKHTANVIIYISYCTNTFYLSRDACIKLGIINSDFPGISATIESCAVHEVFKTCDCIPRVTAPGRPDELPFTCIPANNQKMRE